MPFLPPIYSESPFPFTACFKTGRFAADNILSVQLARLSPASTSGWDKQGLHVWRDVGSVLLSRVDCFPPLLLKMPLPAP